jgi:hypothetical protein
VTPAPFIVGVGRSGTTLLRLMLDAHPDMSIPAETHFLPAIFQPAATDLDLEGAYRTVTGAKSWANLAIEADDYLAALRALKPFAMGDAARAFYRLYTQRKGKSRWGDKTPSYRGHMRLIQEALPEAHFIHLIRDGRDVALSYRGLWFGPGDDIEAQAKFWVREISGARAAARDLRHYMEVRYETLVAEPEATLRGLCAYLSLPYHPSMLDYHQTASSRLSEIKQRLVDQRRTADGERSSNVEHFLSIHDRVGDRPDSGRAGRWRMEMAVDEQRRYEAIAGKLLHELNYETRFWPGTRSVTER